MGRKIKKMNFKSREAYLRWLRYGHATGVFERTPGHVKVYIRGRPHKVKHERPKRKKSRKAKGRRKRSGRRRR